MASIKIIYSVSRYWRCYVLLLVASVLSFVLFYISQNDPNLDHYFPYFRGGSKYSFYYSNTNLEAIGSLMEKNYLDYEFLYTNSRFCLKRGVHNGEREANDKGLNVLDDDQIEDLGANLELNFIILSISQAHHFKYRSAARSTWAKHLKRTNTKLVFFIGNPEYETNPNLKQTAADKKFKPEDKEKLDAELRDYNDIVQINMADNENYTSTKTLIAIRWAFTYCLFAKNVFVLSDSAILNHLKFEKLIKNSLQKLNDNSIVGFCNQTDEKLAYVLKHFFDNLQKNSNKVYFLAEFIKSV
jgi:hypothetical protein